MAKLVYALNQSLDGYVDHDKFAPDPVLFRHFVDDIGSLAAVVYGRRMYEIMRYWDEDQAEWDAAEREYAQGWRSRRKWVASRTLTSVGPNATLVSDDIEAVVRRLKSELDGYIEVAGTQLAASLAGLVDEYRIYLHPVVLGSGTPYFAAPRSRLRLQSADRIGDEVIRLTYVPA
ncbi:dihydrofolate reductase family protein [Phenylobacterium terrae]|uniref:Dihydrofolate reductase family protein n=1 Tax=Phenylobacterium terrae TaxID=2665495 RepID=A0ABW4MWB7_9CAUL